MDTEEIAGGAAGAKWAGALIEAKGVRWLRECEASSTAPEWDAFKGYVDPGGRATDRDIFVVMFGNEPRSAEYIAAFVRSALSIFRRHAVQPH